MNVPYQQFARLVIRTDTPATFTNSDNCSDPWCQALLWIMFLFVAYKLVKLCCNEYFENTPASTPTPAVAKATPPVVKTTTSTTTPVTSTPPATVPSPKDDKPKIASVGDGFTEYAPDVNNSAPISWETAKGSASPAAATYTLENTKCSPDCCETTYLDWGSQQQSLHIPQGYKPTNLSCRSCGSQTGSCLCVPR